MTKIDASDPHVDSDYLSAIFLTTSADESSHLGSMIAPVIEHFSTMTDKLRIGVMGKVGNGKTQLSRSMITGKLTAERVQNVSLAIRSDMYDLPNFTLLHYDTRTLEDLVTLGSYNKSVHLKGFAEHFAMKGRANVEIVEWPERDSDTLFDMLIKTSTAHTNLLPPDTDSTDRVIQIFCSPELSQTDEFQSFLSQANVYSCE